MAKLLKHVLKEGAFMAPPLCKLMAPAANEQAKQSGDKRKRTESAAIKPRPVNRTADPCLVISTGES